MIFLSQWTGRTSMAEEGWLALPPEEPLQNVNGFCEISLRTLVISVSPLSSTRIQRFFIRLTRMEQFNQQSRFKRIQYYPYQIHLK